METDIHKINDGKIVLYKRDNSSRYQFRFRDKETGRWRRYTTKTDDLEESKKISSKLYMKYLLSDELGFDETQIFKKRRKRKVLCRQVIEEVIKNIEKSIEKNEGTLSTHITYVNHLKNTFIPYFGDIPIEDITTDILYSFFQDKKKKLGKPISKSILNINKVLLNRIFKKGIQQQIIKEKPDFPDLDINRDYVISQKRGSFTKSEYMKIIKDLFPEWIEKETIPNIKWNKELLLNIIVFLTNTGIRPGTELLGIKWNDFVYHRDKTGRYLTLHIRQGKTGYRHIVVRDTIDNITIPELQKLFTHLKDLKKNQLFKVDEYVFRYKQNNRVINNSRYQNLFRKFLEEYDMLYDRQGNIRTLYSWRHSYITWLLIDGDLSIHDISKICGNSVSMIEKFYDDVLPTDKMMILSGRMKEEMKKDIVDDKRKNRKGI